MSGIAYGIDGEYRVTEKFNLGLEYSRTAFDDIDGLDLIQIRGSYRSNLSDMTKTATIRRFMVLSSRI